MIQYIHDHWVSQVLELGWRICITSVYHYVYIILEPPPQQPVCTFMYLYRWLQCTIWVSVYFALAKTQHPRQSTLLSRCNRQAICILHGHPHLSVRAVIGNWCNNILSSIGPRRSERNCCLPNGGFQLSGPWSPFDWFTLSVTAINWGLLRSLANCWRLDVVHDAAPDCIIVKFLATWVSIESWESERKGTDLPCVGERNHVVYIYVAGRRPCRTVIGTEPATTCGGAGRTLYHVCTIALQYHLSRIAAPRLSDPMGEEGTTVAGLWALRGDLESRKLALGCGRRRYVGGCRRRSWKSERRGEYCAE